MKEPKVTPVALYPPGVGAPRSRISLGLSAGLRHIKHGRLDSDRCLPERDGRGDGEQA